jgi:Recombination endonuclease VII
MSTKHDGLTPGELAQMREAQYGLCYLCGDPLPTDRYFLAIDHDHRCCPLKRSCAFCRRGLTCHSCNVLIGHAKDDPARLRRIADNLEAAITAATPRIACKPAQLALVPPRPKRRPAPRRKGTLADVLAVFQGDKALHWQDIADRLAARFPDRWATVTPRSISAECIALGVPSVDVRRPTTREGIKRRGCRRADVKAAATPLAA